MKKATLHRSSEAGFNLIEVLIATALVGTVVISIMALFFSGQFNVYSGKQMSQAVALGTHVMEDLQGQTLDGVRSMFGAAGAALGPVEVDGAVSLPHNSYTGSVLRKSNSITTGQDPLNTLAKWQNEIKNNNKLGNGYVAVVMTPLNPPTGATVTMNNATVMRLRVLVRWQENARWRQIVLDTVKTERP